LVATSAVVIAGVGAMAGAAVYIHYRSLQADILTFEERQAQKEIAIQELKASTANFKVVLAKLTAEEKSIVSPPSTKSPECRKANYLV
jgi:tRNA A58 N-methylase Trm61